MIKPVAENPTVIIVGLFIIVSGCGTAGAITETGTITSPANTEHGYQSVNSTEGSNTSTGPNVSDEVSEEEYKQSVPEKDDPYFEAAASDGSWVSYENPRDEYRSPYLGSGSAKMCITLRNEAGETIVGETVPNTTVTIPTGDTLEWHSAADPITVTLPLTQYSDRPLDADQFGTSTTLPQGDGYLDSHCFEFHGLSEDSTVEYGEAQVTGEYADEINVVGYIQQEHEAWDSNIDPIADAESYEKAGGGWTYQPEASHGQVVIVLQLDSPEAETLNGSTEATTGMGNETNESVTDTRSEEPTSETNNNGSSELDDDTGVDEMPGFGVLVTLLGLSIIIAVWCTRDSSGP